MKPLIMSICLLFLGANEVLMADDFSGQYHGTADFGHVQLHLEQNDQGQFEGALMIDDYPIPVLAESRGGILVGVMDEGDGEVVRFTASRFNDNLNLVFEDGESLMMSPGSLPNSAAPPAWDEGTEQVPAPQEYAGQPPAQGSISINGQVLSEQQVQQLAQYGIQAQAGDYWYDPVCGAWGAWGGPTAGFVQAGIPAPPLPHNASNGTTGVFVNGRNIANEELLYLQSLAGGAIYPGQYWLDHMGNAGFVGGPPLINYLEAARNQGGGGAWYGKGSSGWSSADGSGGVWIANPYGGTGTTVTY